jgi:putative FmdB family regulatory protein
MPFYEYECASCKFYTEVMQRISDEPLTKCPSCGKKALKKLVSAPNFRLKGGGWYETDFKGDSESKRNLAGADKDESAAKPADSSKGETVKAESPAADSSKGEASKPKTETKAEGASKSSDSKSVTRKAKSGGRASKPPSRAAASRPKPVASRGKSKSSSPARKKARR